MIRPWVQWLRTANVRQRLIKHLVNSILNHNLDPNRKCRGTDRGYLSGGHLSGGATVLPSSHTAIPSCPIIHPVDHGTDRTTP